MTFDSSDLSVSVYTGTLCVADNAPVMPELALPVTMTVVPFTDYLPVVAKN